MEQTSGNELYWNPFPNEFAANSGHDQNFDGGHEQGFDPLMIDSVDPSLQQQFDLSNTNAQPAHGYSNYDGQGSSRPSSTQPYTNAAFSFPAQTTNPSFGQGRPLSPNAQFIPPTGGQAAQSQVAHGFGGHQYSPSIDHGSAYAGSNSFPTGSAPSYQGNPYESAYLQHQSFANGNPLAAQQHDEYSSASNQFVNDPLSTDLHPQSGQLGSAWHRQGSPNQYSNGTLQTPHRDDSPYGQSHPYQGHRGAGAMSLTPNAESHPAPVAGGHGQFPIQAQQEATDVRTPQPHWPNSRQPFSAQQQPTYLQQQSPGSIHQVANQPQSGRGSALPQQTPIPFSGPYNSAPANNFAHLRPQNVSPTPGYVPSPPPQQQQQKQANAPAVTRPSQSQPASRISTQQAAQPVNTTVPVSQDGGYKRSVPVPLPVPPKLIVEYPVRILPSFTSPAVQAENAKTTGSFFVAFAKRTVSAANVPKHIRPFNPVAVDPDKKLGMCFPQKRLLPCELLYQHQQAPPEERRALEQQLKNLLGKIMSRFQIPMRNSSHNI